MSKLIIRKRVSLEFLGDEYKDAYIDFRAIPVDNYDDLMTKVNEGAADNSKANKAILDILKEYYLGGKFPNEKGELEDIDSKEELGGLTADAVLECFGKMTGQDLSGVVKKRAELVAEGAPQAEIENVKVDVDPKSDTLSKPGSTAENQPPEK